MKKKRCGKCFTDIPTSATYCPQCGSTENWLRTPDADAQQRPLEVWKPRPHELMPQKVQTSYQSDLDDSNDWTIEDLNDLNEELGEEKVSLFQRRLERELEEIQYLKWRAMQPSWMEHNASSSDLGAMNSSINGSHLTTFNTAKGVFFGTAMMRSHLSSIQESLSEDSDTEDSTEDLSFEF